MSQEEANTENNTESGIQRRMKNLRPWKKGEKVPGAGRPKGSISITEAVKRELKKRDPEDGKKYLEKFVEATLDEAINEREPQIMKLLWAYVDGTPLQKAELSGKDGGPIPIAFVFDGIEHEDTAPD